MINLKDIDVIVIGGSAGGIKAVGEVLKHLPKNFSIPIVIVLHRPRNVPSTLQNVIQYHTALKVKEADEKETITPSCAYIAPANYHLLIERDRTFAMDNSEKVKYSRPSIDITFESVAHIYGSRAVGILLTGANRDGANGLLKMKQKGARCYAQDPKTAEVTTMPKTAIKLNAAEEIIPLDQIGVQLKNAAH